MKAFFVGFTGLVVLGLQMPSFTVAEEAVTKPVFEDKFDGELAKGWTWLHEDPKAWRIGKDGLELKAIGVVQRRNVVLGPVYKAGSELMAEVFAEIHVTAQFEHAGLKCFFDEKNFVGLSREGQGYVGLTLQKDGKSSFQTVRPPQDGLWLRLVAAQGKAVGFYRAKTSDEWTKVGEWELPGDGDFRFGLSAGCWPKGTEDWARFRDFRVLPLAK